MSERIVSSAVKHCGQVFVGLRHHDAIRAAVEATGVKPVTGEQGFLDAGGKFLTIEEAATRALETGQIKELRYGKLCLYSEDLW